MELDKARVRLMLKPEKIDIIEGLIQKELSEANTSIFEEIKKILNRTFGEENNQLVKPTLENILERICIPLGNSYHNINTFTEERLLRIIGEVGIFYIIIHFPEIRITNERKEEHIIKDLYVRFGLNNEGLLRDHLSGVRGSITLHEYDAGYLHSHIDHYHMNNLEPTVPPLGDTIENETGGITFDYFCTGEGPVIQVMTKLRIKFDANIFQLFCLHVKSFVQWESLEGVPYVKINTIPTTSGVRRRAIRFIQTPLLKTFAKRTIYQLLSRWDRYNITLTTGATSVIDKGIIVGESTELRSIINRVVIENKEKIFLNRNEEAVGIVTRASSGFVVPHCYDDEYDSEDSIEDHRIVKVRNANRTLLTFKGQAIKLKLLDINDKKEENEEETLYAHPGIVTAVLTEISTILTEKAREIRRAEIANSTN